MGGRAGAGRYSWAWERPRTLGGMEFEREFAPGAGPVLRTSRLRLRSWQEADAGMHRRLWSERDPRVPTRRRIGADGRPTVADLEEWIRRGRETTTAEVPGTLVVEPVARENRAEGDAASPETDSQEHREAIGYCGLVRTSHDPEDRIEIAYELLRQSHGRGLATEAAGAVLEYAFAVGHRRIWASVWEWNTASFRVLQKLGFRDSGERDVDEALGTTIWMVREGRS